MLARDSTGRSVQVLHPMDNGGQTIAPSAGSAARNDVPFKGHSIVVGVRVRSVEKVRLRLGGDTVVAAPTDCSLSADDGWVYLSLTGKDDAGDTKPRATHLSILAGTQFAASVDVQEFN